MPEKRREPDFPALIEEAARARERAYAPYSGYTVGAALLAADGRIFCGCNIEFASYSPTNCAERTALFQAVAWGCRRFAALAVVGGPRQKAREELDYFMPCGVCRQALREFCGTDFPVAVAGPGQTYQVYRLGELLPQSFGPENVSLAVKEET